ncbi:MarR family transcriptional regulator [Bacillus cereus]|nr:MarR family transcriptional regulator [Bacillus cereus]
MKNNNLLLSDHLCFAIYAASREMIKLYHPLLKELGITYPQYLVLLVLWEKEQMSVKGLGEELYLDSGTLTPVLKRLEERGLIIRERSKEDERSVIITLTAEGHEFKEKVTSIPNTVFDKTGCNAEEIKSYNTSIRNLLKTLTSD